MGKSFGGGVSFEACAKKKELGITYDDIISLDNLLLAWTEFKKGKTKKPDVQEFELRLMDNLIALHESLRKKTYQHGPYQAFKVNDPKPRDIHKASVRDRVLHHALYHALAPYFFTRFIADSYSCQDGKGTHRALKRFETFARRVSKNRAKQCFVLKGDIRKCFASVDQAVLLKILRKHIHDTDVMWLLERVIGSFDSGIPEKGLPLGNITSQLLINIYLNGLDQFVKQQLKAKYYIRYADDFVVFSRSKDELETILTLIDCFLRLNLRLELHPEKVFIKTLGSGVDFLGWVHFADHRVLRMVTKRWMLKKLKPENLSSYLGMLSWGNGRKLAAKLGEQFLQG